MSTRKPIIAGNWKMHLTHLDAIQFVQKLSYLVDRATTDQVDVVICPPFTALRSVQTTIQADKLAFGLGAQNVFPEKEGAFTGEISPVMLAKLDVEHCIVGHSERRQAARRKQRVCQRQGKGSHQGRDHTHRLCR